MKRFFIFAIIFINSFALQAQEQIFSISSPEELRKSEKYPINWFVGVGGGVNISTDMQQYSNIKTGSGTGNSLDIYAGKWITQRFGVRTGYHGFSTSFNDVDLPSKDHGSHPFYYLHADAIFRPTQWLVPYVHAGYINVTHRNAPTNTVHKHAIGGGVGIMLPIKAGDFRIVPGMRMTMMNGNVATWEDINKKEIRFKFSATIGLAYTFGKQKPHIVREEIEVPVEVLRIDTLRIHTHTTDTIYVMQELQTVANKINARTHGDVLFDINSAHLRAEAYPILLEVVDFMKQNPEIHAVIEGHACIMGFDSINQPLSERRAQAVYDFLHAHGIDYKKLNAVGYGSKRPKASNETEDGRKQNRRIEFVFTLNSRMWARFKE